MIPRELIVKMMNDPVQRSDFLDFSMNMTEIHLSAVWGKRICWLRVMYSFREGWDLASYSERKEEGRYNRTGAVPMLFGIELNLFG